jgi:tetratricopeptide (TPR) repeat protein
VKRQQLFPLLVVAAGLLAYSNSFQGAFIFDDRGSILENPTIRHLWPIWHALSPPHKGGITVESRPLVNFSLAINYALGGTDVRGYHALNLTIHILAGLTLLGVVRRTLLQPGLREHFGAAANGLALATAVLWTVHPLQTESVTYVIQRAESMMGLFYLLTLYCFIRGADSERPGPWYGLCVTACALGMASKEVMATAPLMVLLYDRAFVSGSLRGAWRHRGPLYLALASAWIVLGCLLPLSLGNVAVNAKLNHVVWWKYLLTEPGAILHYLQLSVWPHPLCFDYSGWRLAGSWMSIVPPALVIATLLSAGVGAWKANSAWGFLGAWFFLILAPSSSIIPTDSPAYEHRMYLPLAAVAVVAVMGIYRLLGQETVVAVLVLVIGLGTLTWRRNQDYRSELTIWGDTVAKRPNNARARNNLGNALLDAGRLPEAIGQFELALRLDPNLAQAQLNYGVALTRMGKTQEAVGHWEQALRIKPDYAEAHNNLANVQLQVGNVREAISHYEQALQIKPDYAMAHNNLGVALLRAGKVHDAIGHFEQALRIEPPWVDVQNGLARLLATLTSAEGGDPVRAVTLAQQACERTRNRVANYLDTLAVAYAAAGRFDAAVDTAQKAIELARAAGQPKLAGEIETRLHLYRDGRVYRESVGVPRSSGQ